MKVQRIIAILMLLTSGSVHSEFESTLKQITITPAQQIELTKEFHCLTAAGCNQVDSKVKAFLPDTNNQKPVSVQLNGTNLIFEFMQIKAKPRIPRVGPGPCSSGSCPDPAGSLSLRVLSRAL